MAAKEVTIGSAVFMAANRCKNFNPKLFRKSAKVRKLLTAAGYANDPQGFLSELIEKLGDPNSANGFPLEVNGIHLPNLFVLAILEKIIPGNRFISIFGRAQPVGGGQSIEAGDRNVVSAFE
ncbi:MAG: hypothetical protein PVI06_12230 [Desulfobacterales bacterium]